MTIVPRDPRWFAPGIEMWAGETRLVVATVRPYRDRGVVVRFEGVDDRISAETLRGAELFVEGDARPDLGEGEFWPEDLVGLEAVDPSGGRLGEVVDVVPGPQDRLVVETPDGRRIEVPFVHDLVGDPEGRRIEIDPPMGMFDEE